MMQDNRLKITRVVIHNFGSIKNFEGNFSDVVLIESGIDSKRTDDIIMVLRSFMNIGLITREGHDFRDDFVSEYNAKFKNRTYIEIGFVFDTHEFYYRHFYDMDGKMEQYVRDVQSRFTMRGELCYAFMTYIMNPYAMEIAVSSSLEGAGSMRDDYPEILSRLLDDLAKYEPITGITNIFGFSKGDYDSIKVDLTTKYFTAFQLLDDMSCKLARTQLECYCNDIRMVTLTLDRRHKKAYQLACYILANEIVSRISALESSALANGPLLLDMELYWDIKEHETANLIKRYLLPLKRQVFIAEYRDVTKMLWEDDELPTATVITDNSAGLQCVTRALY